MMYILVAIHSHFFISSNILAFSVPNESYSRNASSSLNLISAFLLIGVSSSTFHYFVIFWQNAILDFIDVLLFMRYKRLKQVNFMRLLNTQRQFKQKTPDNNNGRKKKTEVQTMIYKTLHRKQKILQHEPTQKNGDGGLKYPRRVFSSCSTSGTREGPS